MAELNKEYVNSFNDGYNIGYKNGRKQAIEEFAETLLKNNDCVSKAVIRRIALQLKGK